MKCREVLKLLKITLQTLKEGKRIKRGNEASDEIISPTCRGFVVNPVKISF